MDKVLEWIERAERAAHTAGDTNTDNIRAWMIRQRADQTYVQRLVSMIQRMDLEKRPPPSELRSFLFRGVAYELVSWPINGYHPPGCVWFPSKDAWLLLRRSPVMPVIALPTWLPTAEDDGAVDLANAPKFEHESDD